MTQQENMSAEERATMLCEEHGIGEVAGTYIASAIREAENAALERAVECVAFNREMSRQLFADGAETDPGDFLCNLVHIEEAIKRLKTKSA